MFRRISPIRNIIPLSRLFAQDFSYSIESSGERIRTFNFMINSHIPLPIGTHRNELRLPPYSQHLCYDKVSSMFYIVCNDNHPHISFHYHVAALLFYCDHHNANPLPLF